MDRAYEDNETRELAVKQGFVPVVPPKRNRKNPWEYDKELYKRRNEVERYFLRIYKGYTVRVLYYQGGRKNGLQRVTGGR